MGISAQIMALGSKTLACSHASIDRDRAVLLVLGVARVYLVGIKQSNLADGCP